MIITIELLLNNPLRDIYFIGVDLPLPSIHLDIGDGITILCDSRKMTCGKDETNPFAYAIDVYPYVSVDINYSDFIYDALTKMMRSPRNREYDVHLNFPHKSHSAFIRSIQCIEPLNDIPLS